MVTVCIRKRPLINNEYNDTVEIYQNNILINQPKKHVNLKKYTKKYSYKFPYVFSEQISNKEIFDTLLKNKIADKQNDNDLLFCVYGETGAGKTYTLLNKNGLVELTLRHLILKKYSIYCTAYEIYNNRAYDLINPNTKCPIRQNYNGKMVVCNLKDVYINNNSDASKFVATIMNNRVIGQSAKNNASSRSHVIIDLRIISNISAYERNIKFIDLAGNERGADSMANNRQQFIEGAEINTSLLSFKECIRSMHNKNSHIPFRRSCLTKILRDYFINKCDIIIMGNIGPDIKSVNTTLNTLNYTSMLLKLNYRRVVHDVKKSNYGRGYRPTNIANSNANIFPNLINQPNQPNQPKISNNKIDTSNDSKIDTRRELAVDTMLDIFICFIENKKRMYINYMRMLDKFKTDTTNKVYWSEVHTLIKDEYQHITKFKSIISNPILQICNNF